MIKLPIGVDINNLIDDLRIFIWEAADILFFYSQLIKDSKNKNEIIQTKENQDPVTLADLEVNELIINKLNEKYKDINWEILSEENVKLKSNQCDTAVDWLWILDPLDGTKDFIQGTGEYAIHLALNYKQKPYLGFVLIPEKNEFWISNGEKVWCERRDRSIKRNNINQKHYLNQMTIVTSKNHRNKELKKLIDHINFKNITVMGSIGCKIAAIIRGEADIYISLSLPGQSSPKDWDFAAPEAILKAAGGKITNMDNKDLSYGGKDFAQKGIIIATKNNVSHEKICMEIREIIIKNKIFPYL